MVFSYSPFFVWNRRTIAAYFTVYYIYVLDKPIFRGIPTKITVVEGGNSTGNNFTVISNPPPSKYTWFKVCIYLRLGCYSVYQGLVPISDPLYLCAPQSRFDAILRMFSPLIPTVRIIKNLSKCNHTVVLTV